MAGWMVGSLLLSWILCSGLNAFVENLVCEGRLERRAGFVSMVAVLSLVLAGMLWLCLQVFPHSAQAASLYLSPTAALPVGRVSAGINALFVLAYAGFQLQRFWEDE